ncbi:MAG TPA: hypothetical protein VF526_17550, partial [Solirubrobacteraceae bacterium]
MSNARILGRVGRVVALVWALAWVALLSVAPAGVAVTKGAADASVELDPASGGGRIAGHFVGFSIEWSLIERYMGPAARPAFANLLANLGAGVLRIGGSSQGAHAVRSGGRQHEPGHHARGPRVDSRG